MSGRITTYTGRQVDPLNLWEEDVVIEDIAHSLAFTCRFNGHTKRFLSVAEHSIRVSERLEQSHGPKVALQGLVHDASEAYIHDVVKPIKALYTVDGKSFETLEQELLSTISRALRVPFPFDAAVWVADQAETELERDLWITAPQSPVQSPVEIYNGEYCGEYWAERFLNKHIALRFQFRNQEPSTDGFAPSTTTGAFRILIRELARGRLVGVPTDGTLFGVRLNEADMQYVQLLLRRTQQDAQIRERCLEVLNGRRERTDV